MFRWIVTACLVLMTYGVLYHNLPCWAQLLDKTMYCQMKESVEQYQKKAAAAAEAHRRFNDVHHGRNQDGTINPLWKERQR